MSLIEDARQLLKPGLYEEPTDGAMPWPRFIFCGGESGHHAEDCPWPRRAQIVAVLEAAQDLVDAAEEGPYPVGAEGPMPWNEWQALRRALTGEGVKA